MSGAGSIKHMIDSYKANRNLLKRRSSGRYKNFDTSYITDYPTGKAPRIPIYNKATPSYMQELRAQLVEDRKILRRKNVASIIMACMFVFILAIILF